MSTPHPPLPPELSPRGPSRAKPSAATVRAPRVAGRSRARRVGTVVTAAASASVLAFSLIGSAVWGRFDSNIARIDAGTAASDPAAAQNYLLVGSDNRENLTPEQIRRLHLGAASSSNGAGQRSDTMILLHTSANGDKATLISLPRDSYVTIPAWTDTKGVKHSESHAKLNAAYERGGPALAVKTVELATGVTINHYVEIGFGGFVHMVDALGGIDVCSPRAVHDPKSGLTLVKGNNSLDGGAALRYVRARYIDGSADIGRMRRQQQFLGAVFRKALSTGTLLNPLKLNDFLSATASAITTDNQLTHEDVINLVTRTKGLSPSSIVFATVPIANLDYRPSPALGSTVLWDATGAHALFTAIEGDQPIGSQTAAGAGASAGVVAVAPNRINVRVYNGSSVVGLGSKAANELTALGFVSAGAATNATDKSTTATVIQYDPGFDQSLKTLQAVYPDAQAVPVKGQGKVFKVIVGTSYQTAKAVKVGSAPSTTATAPGGVRTSSAADDVCKL